MVPKDPSQIKDFEKLFAAFLQSQEQDSNINSSPVKKHHEQQSEDDGDGNENSNADMALSSPQAPSQSARTSKKTNNNQKGPHSKPRNRSTKPPGTRGIAKTHLKPKKPRLSKAIASHDDEFGGLSSPELSKSPQQLRSESSSQAKGKGKARSSQYENGSQLRVPENPTHIVAAEAQPDRKEKLSRRAHSRVSYAPKKKFILGLDYGTTFTSISYYTHSVDDFEFKVLPGDIKSIVNWPMASSSEIRQVPSQSWYPLVPRSKETALNGDQSDDETDTDNPIASTSKVNWSTEIVTHTNQTIDSDAAESFLWGYEVPYFMYKAGTSRNVDRYMDRPKLLLVQTKYTESDRKRLRPRLDGLIRAGIVHRHGESGRPAMQDLEDIIADFLIRIFRHTKQQLQENEGLTDNSEVEFVMTVPVIWHQGSSRIMQNAIARAIHTTGLGTLSYGSIDNLFVASEPESAATYLMGLDNDLMAGDTFVVLDCGGGTVDVAAFDISSTYPLRLAKEVDSQLGDNCGASYLNDNFETRVLERLADENYLDVDGTTREAIVRQLVLDFETYDKRFKDVTKSPESALRIPGLRGDMRRGLKGSEAKRFEDNQLILDSSDYDAIFMPILRRVGKVLRDQLEVVIAKDKMVEKVFLVGGFGAAPSLRSYLRQFLGDLVRELNLQYEIELVTTSAQESVSAIASGAVLRAMDKTGGPARRSHSSYGFLRFEPYSPELIPAHKEQIPEVHPLDGHKFVTTIDYFIYKGMLLKPFHKFSSFTCEHNFELWNEDLLCEEILYVADSPKRSHYHPDHEENKGAQKAGEIITSMKDFLCPEIIVHPGTDKDGNLMGEEHYHVSYELIPVVEGRNLRYETKVRGQVRKTGQISIASAFRPGTY
ncbi:hypothetical protein HYFRA_00009931 [Hymenoscyphus fraxineus]|uniref:Uncharacterized protein n=1 Tax=Hymenoscyphus fraxineus TaxID=746836 RepID=A0A9N9L3U5_9HELO|nr:hypothetical protein HYFRA_00009931 [Hymenoscyphus fraxineus]